MYVVGQTYRHVCGFKNGFPVYEMTTIKEVHQDKLILANGAIIDYMPAGLPLPEGLQRAA